MSRKKVHPKKLLHITRLTGLLQVVSFHSICFFRNVFIPSCLAHTILTHRDWGRVEVNSVELTRALKCWESGGIIEESNFIPKRYKNPIQFEMKLKI